LSQVLGIEAANLIEQGGESRNLQAQIAQSGVSEAAKRTIAEYISEAK
jgi:hypothetical protein